MLEIKSQHLTWGGPMCLVEPGSLLGLVFGGLEGSQFCF